MKVLVLCEYSGVVRDAFIRKGHEAVSCDILPSESNLGPHIQDDMFKVLKDTYREWDLLIAHPPCTYLSVSGLHWNKKDSVRREKTESALRDVCRILNYAIPKIALENPVGCISTRIRKPDQYIQPYNFGHDASKKTGLWLKDLPVLKTTCYVLPRVVNGLPRWSNQTDSGQNRLGPSEDRAKIRSRTYQGIADAMADQWGNL